MEIIKAADYQGMSRKAANIISAQVILFPKSVLGLATGSTPLGIYKQLVNWYQKGDIDFRDIRSVNLDEYCELSPEDPQSYHYYMQENFFKYVNFQRKNIQIPNGLANDIEEECVRYDKIILDVGGIDLQLLGLGNTGHIGFNEPDQCFDKMTHRVKLSSQTITDNSRFFKSMDEVPRHAITMGIKAIMQARKILLVVNGDNKSEILEKVLFGPVTPEVPASILQLHPNVIVIADEDALSTIRLQHPNL
jgi:glucosamine-6-phosphate deaminase